MIPESNAAYRHKDTNACSGITLGREVHTARLSGAIICTEGCLWITVEHDITDHIIRAGDSFTPPSGRHAVAMGLPVGSFITI